MQLGFIRENFWTIFKLLLIKIVLIKNFHNKYYTNIKKILNKNLKIYIIKIYYKYIYIYKNRLF